MIRMYAAVLALLTATLAASAAPLRMSVASFNIRYGTADDGPDHWQRRRDLVIDTVGRLEADLVGLQEALYFQINEIRSKHPRYAAIGVGRNDGAFRGEYCAILYRHDRFTVAAAGTFWLSDTPETVASATWGNRIPRICTWARLVDRMTGRGLYVYNAHLDHQSQPSREQSVRLIAERIAARAHDEPFVLMGDFNSEETNRAMAFLLRDADGPGLVDSYRAVHPEGPAGTFNGFRGDTEGDKIDYILVPAGVEVVKAAIDRTDYEGRYPSDHFPITATLAFPEPEAD